MKSYRKLEQAMINKSSDEFVISEDITNEGVKMFHVTTLDAIKNKISKKRSHYYGFISYPCKFFIDINLEDEDMEINIKEIKKILSTKIKIAKKGNLFYRLVFPSIIINNSEEGEAKCKFVMDNMKSDVKHYIDTCVYFKDMQYLLLGCSKKRDGIPLEALEGNFTDFFLKAGTSN